MSTQVKICGITSTADAEVAVEAGADAIGFMFFEQSPRYVSPEQAAKIRTAIGGRAVCVGVFVNPSRETVQRILDACGIDSLQFHGEEPPEFCHAFRTRETSDPEHPVAPPFVPSTGSAGAPRIIKAFRIRDAQSIRQLAAYRTDAWLLDSYAPGQRGGTGARFNWDLAVAAKALGRPIILAGGLTPVNVGEAIRVVRPDAVDVSSGVESAPGRKDPAKVRAFIEAARQVSVLR